MTRDERIADNLGLARACAGRFTGKGIEYDDLYSAACLGLVKAVDRYDESRGCCFSTYAVPVILGEIRLLFREGGSVRLSRSLQALSVRAKRIVDEHRQRTGEDIGIGTLAERLGCDIYAAQEALNALRPVMSLSYDNDAQKGAADVPVPSGEDRITERMSLLQTMEALSMDERELIRLRYFKHQTQAQTAEILHTSQVQISRKEKKILLKMRTMLL